MNIYQGLLFLHGFRMPPEDPTKRESAAVGCCGAAARMSGSAAATPQRRTGGSLFAGPASAATVGRNPAHAS